VAENPVASTDWNATAGSETNETVEYCAALDGGLLTLQGTVGPRNNTRKILFTLDTAATLIYMSATKAKAFWKGQIIPISPRTIVLPNSNTIVSQEGIVIPYTIGTWNSQLEARLVDIQGYDVILGLSWFMRHNPSINWPLGTVTLANEDTHEPVVIKSTSRIFNLEEESPTDFVAALCDMLYFVTAKAKSVATWPLKLLAMQQDSKSKLDI
jgi:hypothetical protein